LKKIAVVKSSEVEVKPFNLDDFTQNKAKSSSMGKVSKKELKSLATKLGMKYSDSQIEFTKKLMTAYLAYR
jgi:hypothetical protein